MLGITEELLDNKASPYSIFNMIALVQGLTG